jgi:hypothetical protein
MQDYRVETKVSSDGSLTINDVPFRPGDRVEVIIRSHDQGQSRSYTLRGKPIRYSDPFGSVAEEDWEVVRQSSPKQ